MAPASPASSSSGFSSSSEDDDAAPPATTALGSVHVEVVPEPASSLIAAPCLAATAPLLGTQTSTYDAFAAAVALVSRYYDDASNASDAPADDPVLRAYAALRASLFRRFQQAFPLPADLYTLWLADVTIASDDAVAAQLQVFELALRDYLSVPLALEFARFLDAEGLRERAETLEQTLLCSAGLHYTHGHAVWRFYREQAANDERLSPLAKETRVRSLYVRQLALPLQQNDVAMSEFRAWSAYHPLNTSVDTNQLVAAAATQQRQVIGPLLKQMNAFEDRLEHAVAAGEAVEAVWLEYLDFVTHRVVPVLPPTTSDDFVVTMWERAVAMACLSSTLWTQYAAFVRDSTSTSDADRLALAERRVHNVSFDASAWNALLLELERQDASIEQLTAVVEERIVAHTDPLLMDAYHSLSVLLTYCDVHRRSAAKTQYDAHAMQRLERAFSACEAFVETHFPSFPAGVTQVLEYHAKCVLLATEDADDNRTRIAKWTALWDRIVGIQRHAAHVWIALFHESVRTGVKSAADIRTAVLERALEHVTDYPVAVLELWLVFERENGSLADFLRVQQLHTDAVARVTNAVASEPTSVASESVARESKKRKGLEGSDAKATRAREAKRAKLSASRPETTRKETPQRPSPVTTTATTTTTTKQKTHDVLTNAHTLFVSNISKDVTQDEFTALFTGLPGLQDVRLVVKTRASHVKSRGMAYVQFADELGVAAGLAKHGLELKGKALSVERSKPPSTTTPADTASDVVSDLSRDGSWKTDPVTIYVGGLVRANGESISEDEVQVGLEQALEAAGEPVVVQRVSILKDRRGKPKEYGLVQVASVAHVRACVEHTAAVQKVLGEQITLKPSRFSIDQIVRQQQTQLHDKSLKPPSAGRGARSIASTAAPTPRKPSLGLMPRALRRKPTLSASGATGATVGVVAPTVSTVGATTQAPAARAPPPPPPVDTTAATSASKTNADFRKLLLKQ